MKSNLSAFYYIKNNKKEVAIRLVSLVMAFLVIYVVSVLLYAITEGTNVFVEQSKHVVYMNLSEETRGFDINSYTDMNEAKAADEKSYADIANKLNNQDGIKEAYATKGIRVKYTSILGSMGVTVPLMDKDKIPDYIDGAKAKLIEGDMPETEGEVVIDKKLLKNNDLEVGDYLFDDEKGGYKVSGVVESDYYICSGIPSGTVDGNFITCLIDDDVTDMSEKLENIGINTDKDKDIVMDYKITKDTHQHQIKDIVDGMITGMTYIIMIFISVALIVAYISFMRNRMGEYCMYASVGFARREIYFMIMKEIIILFTLGAIIGLLTSFAGIYLLEKTFIASKGMVIKMFYPEVISKILISFAVIIGLLQLPILSILNKIKTIDMIED